MKKTISYLIALFAIGTCCVSAQVINCPSGFTNTISIPCGVGVIFPVNGYAFRLVGSTNGSSPGISGTQVNLAPTGATHVALNLNYATAVNVQAFTTNFTFVANGWNVALTVQNNSNTASGGGDPRQFTAGAGCEGSFYQAFPFSAAPNNLFAINLDSDNGNTVNSNTFTYSHAQIYQSIQTPCNPNDGQSPYANPQDTISTSPVPLNSPTSTKASPTGDTYSATIIYDGWNLTLNLFDVTAGGSCPGVTCFSHTWSGVNLPSIVNGTTAFVGLAAGTNAASTAPLLINTWSYTVNTPTGTPSYTAWNANSTTNTGTVSAASPVYSVAPGAYSGTQTVTISSTTSASNICYVLSASTPTFFPQPDNLGGCVKGTPYTVPVSISSTQTLYAMAGTNATTPPSTLVAGTYTIGGVAAPPTALPLPGFYSSTQNVALTTISAGATICYTVDGSTPLAATPGTCSHGTTYSGAITVAATTTINAIATLSGVANSSVQSFLYTISGASPVGAFMVGGTINGGTLQ